jgi:amino acid adenylation domain-containing protein
MTNAGASATRVLPLSLLSAADSCARRERLPLDTLLAAAVSAVFARWSQQRAFVFGVGSSEEPGHLPSVMIDVDRWRSFRGLSHSIARQLVGAARGDADAPLAAAFVRCEVEQQPTAAGALDGADLICSWDGRERLTLRGRRSAHESNALRTFAEQLVTSLELWIRRPLLCSVAQGVELRAAELAAVQSAACGPRTAPPKAASLFQLFTEQCARNPGAIAVRERGRNCTYAELLASVRSLASGLAARGIAPGQSVALGIGRSLGLVQAMLAVHAAGAHYLPVDPAYPRERLRYILADAGASLLIHDSGANVFDDLGADCERSQLSQLFASANGAFQPRTADIAYLLYTSGSTGHPKGVITPQRAVVNRIGWLERAFPSAADDVWLQRTSPSFVDSALEIFGALLSGRPLEIADDTVARDPAALLRLLAASDITRVVITPTLLRGLLATDASLAGFARVRLCFISGEPLRQDLASAFLRAQPSCRLINLYGASELSGDSHYHECRPSLDASIAPIGAPIDNVESYVVDEAGQPCAPGFPGELLVGGSNVAVGYHNQPDLTARRFVHSAFGSGRWFRTGDRARLRADGEFEYLGRVDDMIKLRGFRIEPREVESAMERHASVRQCVVLARGMANGEHALVAYFTAIAPAPSTAELQRHAREHLPPFMQPAQYVELPELPCTPSGKLDRRALGAIELAPLATKRYVGPRTPLEEILAWVWSDVLGVPQLGVLDDFFELGGHSLLATCIISRLREELDVELALSDFFAAPTIAELARVLEPQLRSEQPGACA